VFMKAAELLALLSENWVRELKIMRIEGQKSDSLRELVELFLAHYFTQGVMQPMAELLDLNQVLIHVDGLDEATSVLGSLMKVVKAGVPLRMLLSIRKHSYAKSRACLRLGEFGVVKLEPLTPAEHDQTAHCFFRKDGLVHAAAGPNQTTQSGAIDKPLSSQSDD